MTEKPIPAKEKSEISLKDLLLHIRDAIHFLFGKWKVILICGFLGLLAGLAHAFLSVPQYSATISFVTDTNQDGATGVSSYAGLAAAFGLNLGNNGLGNSLFSGDNIYDLMKTRRMLGNTLLTTVNIDGKKTLLIDRYIQMEELRKKWKDNPHLKDLVFDIDTSRFTIYHNRIISSICKSLIKNNLQFPDGSSRSGGSSSLMSATVISPDEQFSAFFATKLMENVSKYYVGTVTKTARNTLNVLNKQLDSVQNQLYGAMSNVASFSDKNLNLVRQGPQVQQQKRTLKMQVNSAIYQQLVSAVETAKMNLQKETPLFEIVDRPVFPLDIQRPGKIFWSFIGLVAGILLSCGCLLLSHLYTSVMKEN